MARHRQIVAWVEVESPQARMWRQCSTGDDSIDTKPRVLLRSEDGGYGEERAHYWCAADKPLTDDSFAVAPVYRTHKIPDDAYCEHCRIRLRDLVTLL